jgi:gliding motility-associated-like protein
MVFRAFLLVVIISIFKSSASAQVDTAFWFAAPEVTALHADRPILIHISALRQPAIITISQPANPSFATIRDTIPANTLLTIDLTNQIDIIENKPPNQVLNYGLLITSSTPTTSYYEVLGSNSNGIGTNSELFVLKGNRALGTEFYVPFQTHWDNIPNIEAWPTFDIVATEDNTIITITPTQDIVGHSAGISFTVTLQKGQTYSSQGTSILGSNHPAGSHITSNKPIAVTMKDDSLLEGTHWDIAGDQMIPVNSIGAEYVAIKISDSVNTDRLYILAVNANTNVYLDGNPTPVATLNAGQSFEFQILNPTTYITASDSIYVWHVAGFSQELGGALLLPINCSGSRLVNFTPSTNEVFCLEVLIKAGHEQYFKLNGNTSLVPSSSFSTVNGTSGVWKYAKIFFSNSTIPAKSQNILENDSANFLMAALNGGLNTGFRYGYFSDFGFLDLGSNRKICQGDSIVLNAGYFEDSYLWNTGSKEQYITVKDTGLYIVTGTKGECSKTDSVRINGFYPKITTAVLGHDTAACQGSGLVVSTLFPYSSYQWNTGAKGDTIHPSVTGNYSVVVQNIYGCKKSDTLFATLYTLPKPFIIVDPYLESFCKDSIFPLQANKVYSKYNWYNGDTTYSITTTHNENDLYSLSVVDSNGCVGKTQYQVDCSPIIGLVPNIITPNNDGKNDVFFIKYLRPKKWILEVYNRWGDKVYDNQAYDNSFDGSNLEDGIYYFSLRNVEGKGSYKSWLQIVR